MLPKKLKSPTFCLFVILFASHAWAAEITVSAASSLTDAFKEIGAAYEKQYPDSKVSFNFAASGALLQQIAKGAPVDVFASADQETMDAAEKQGLVKKAERKNFTRNALVLVVPVDGKSAIASMQDLSMNSVKRVALGNPDSVPAGRYAKLALEHEKLWAAIEPKTVFSQNVRQALDYVAREEVDAAFVYVTDAHMMKDKVAVASNASLNTPILYPIAPIAASEKPDEAKRFTAFVLSSVSQEILAKYGFERP